MFRGRTRQGSHYAWIVTGIVVMALSTVACGDDDTDPLSGASIATTTQTPEGGDTAPTAQEPVGEYGTAMVSIPEGTFELALDEQCVLTEVGIGALASSDYASLMIAGPEEIAVVVVELPSGELWSAGAANVTIDGNTMSYAGPATGPGGTAEISVRVDCG
jgi:hypothetical protein